MARHHRAVVVAVAGLALLSVITAVPTTSERGRLEREPATSSTTPAWAVTTAAKTTEINTDMDDDVLIRRLAERYLEAVNTDDDATVAELNCARAAPGLTQIAASGRPVTMTGLERAGAHEWHYLRLAIDGVPAGSRRIVKRDDTWCIED